MTFAVAGALLYFFHGNPHPTLSRGEREKKTCRLHRIMSAAVPVPPATTRKRRSGKHPSTTTRWRRRAERSVLGNFNTKFNYADSLPPSSGATVNSSSTPMGRTVNFRDYEIKYTFGVYPLQQYLVEFPDGRLQAVSIAWDSRPKKDGGQRWFHLYPKERVTYDDELHWTRPSQNWNFMCADCHSTDVRKNYDSATDKFQTRWAEISVGCEACHGPGSQHI